MPEINDPIRVAAVFQDGQCRPVKFAWRGREYLVKKINLVHHHYQGRDKVYYFEVSDDANYFKLQFETDSLRWTLAESYTE